MENNFNQQNSGQGYGVAGLVIGLIAFLLSFIPCIGILAIFLGPAAIVFGSVSIAKAYSNKSSKGLGIAGVSFGSAALLVIFLWVLFIVRLGTKANIEEKIQSIIEWTENFDEKIEPMEDMKSLDDLERALDELEGVGGVIDSVFNDSSIEVHIKVKKLPNGAKKESENEASEEEKLLNTKR
jgi:predicted PurR-regulated permease PerM